MPGTGIDCLLLSTYICQKSTIFLFLHTAFLHVHFYVFGYGGMWNVLVRHGAYISVYCNLKSVSVHKGQKVSTRQALGSVGSDNILQFQLRKETAKLNPEAWLGR